LNDEVYDFGLRLKESRQKAKFTQQNVADRLGVNVGTVKSYEGNTSNPPVDKLETMAFLYHVSLDYLRNFDKRSNIYIDDLPESKQKMITTLLEMMREEENQKTGD
jgi:transcriptional regulator with XRE-family HTH domain